MRREIHAILFGTSLTNEEFDEVTYKLLNLFSVSNCQHDEGYYWAKEKCLIVKKMQELRKVVELVVINNLVNELERLPKVAFTIMLNLNYRYEKE